MDSLKGCLSATDACEALRSGIEAVEPTAEVVSMPLSDGGEGLVACLQAALDLTIVGCEAHDALMRPIHTTYGMTPDGQTAVIEMAAAAGTTLIDETERRPLEATTYGVGELIADALRRGVKHLIIGLGGSCTTDAGAGMIRALDERHVLPLPLDVSVMAACDVSNPLYGEDGAAYVYGPQKGATKADVQLLDERLRAFDEETQRRGLASAELSTHPGAGAAGGLGYGLMAYLRADLRRGIDILLDLSDMDNVLRDIDFVITGEGKSDRQTLMGKVAHGVLNRAKRLDTPTYLVAGAIDDEPLLRQAGFADIMNINEGTHTTLAEMMRPHVASQALARTARRIVDDYRRHYAHA